MGCQDWAQHCHVAWAPQHRDADCVECKWQLAAVRLQRPIPQGQACHLLLWGKLMCWVQSAAPYLSWFLSSKLVVVSDKNELLIISWFSLYPSSIARRADLQCFIGGHSSICVYSMNVLSRLRCCASRVLTAPSHCVCTCAFIHSSIHPCICFIHDFPQNQLRIAQGRSLYGVFC